MLNASLTFTSDDMIEEIKIMTSEYTKESEYELVHLNNSISKNLISCCLNNIKRNKIKVK